MEKITCDTTVGELIPDGKYCDTTRGDNFYKHSSCPKPPCEVKK